VLVPTAAARECRTADGERRPPPAITAGAVAAVAVLVGATLWGLAGQSEPGWLLALDITTGVAGCALVPLLLWAPVPGALLLAALAAVSPAATPPATVGTLDVSRRRQFTTAAGVAAAGTATHAVRGLWRPIEGLPLLWWLVLVVVAHGALLGWGTVLRARRALLDSLRERARRAEAEQGRRIAEARAQERAQMAREMHDVLAHRLSLLATYAGALEYRPDAPPEQLARAAGVVRTGVHQALDELRGVIAVLRDDDSPDGTAPPQPGLADVPKLVAESRDAGVLVEFDDRTGGVEPPPVIGRTAYRVLQEALTNARKHASGAPVGVWLVGEPGSGLELEVSSRLGVATTGLVPGSGTGLVGLTERVRLAGGRLDQERTAAEFRLRAWLPWPG